MRKTQYFYLVGLLGISILFCSCEKEQILMSSSKVEKNLSHTWEKVDMTSEKTHITWQFSEGKLSVMKKNKLMVTGDYSIDVSPTRVHVNTSGFPEPSYNFMNGSWKVISLDDHILVIAGSHSGGTLETEFVRK